MKVICPDEIADLIQQIWDEDEQVEPDLEIDDSGYILDETVGEIFDLAELAVKTKKPIIAFNGLYFVGSVPEVKARLTKQLRAAEEANREHKERELQRSASYAEEEIKELRQKLKDKEALVAKAKKARGK